MKRISSMYTGGEIGIGYYLYLPEDFDKSKKYPLVTFLHGAGERGDGSEATLFMSEFPL